MKGSLSFTVAIVIVLVIITFTVSVFTVDQTEQALVLRFGEPVAGRGLVTEPGLHFKIPFVENVVSIDKRLLDLESPKEEVLASDNTRIEVDAILRYRITDPLKFYQTVGTIERGASQLESLLNSAIRRVLGVASLTQIVRDEREKLMADIRDQVNQNAAELGVAAVDVRIRRADLPEQISEKVFSRMQTERAREAAEFRAQGSERSQTIRAKADRDAVVIRAEAQRKADQTRGEGDADRNRIFAEAFGQDKDFFAFYRSMQAYESSLKSNDTRLVLSPKSEFFRYFANPSGQYPAATPAK
ncbi:MAG: protease modulator HflC [Beijerinckiaceae bacterium]